MNQPQVFRPRYLLPELNQVTGPLVIDLTNNRQTSKAQSVDRVQQLMKSNENVDQLVQLWQKQKQQTPSSYANDSFIISIYQSNKKNLKEEQPTCENSPQIVYNKSNSALFDSNSARKIQHKKTISICLNDLTSIKIINQEESDTFSQSKTRTKENQNQKRAVQSMKQSVKKPLKETKEAQQLMAQLQNIKKYFQLAYAKQGEDRKLQQVEMQQFFINLLEN